MTDTTDRFRSHRELFGAAPPVATMVVTQLLDPRWKIELEVEAQLTLEASEDTLKGQVP